MDSFIEALLSGKTDRIPDEYDWFAPLIGDWDCDYYDEPEKGFKRHVNMDKISLRPDPMDSICFESIDHRHRRCGRVPLFRRNRRIGRLHFL